MVDMIVFSHTHTWTHTDTQTHTETWTHVYLNTHRGVRCMEQIEDTLSF